MVQEIDSLILDNEKIKENGYSLWIYDHKEFFPDFSETEDDACLEYLGNYIEESGERFSPSNRNTLRSKKVILSIIRIV